MCWDGGWNSSARSKHTILTPFSSTNTSGLGWPLVATKPCVNPRSTTAIQEVISENVAAALRIQHPPPVKFKNESPEQRTGGFERIAIDPERLKVSLQQSSKGFAGNVGHVDKAPVKPPRGWTIR